MSDNDKNEHILVTTDIKYNKSAITMIDAFFYGQISGDVITLMGTSGNIIFAFKNGNDALMFKMKDLETVLGKFVSENSKSYTDSWTNIGRGFNHNPFDGTLIDTNKIFKTNTSL